MRKIPIAFFAVLCVLCFVFAPAGVQAASLTLSTHVSDGVSPPSADLLDATLDFSVMDSTLTLAVTNLTPENTGDPTLKIDEIYFNATEKITGLTLTSVLNSNISKWESGFSQGGGPDGGIHQVNGFGKFDVYLRDEPGNPATYITKAGGIVTFIFTISGIGPFSDADFIELSTQVDSHIISYAAAKFYNGPPEMSAYGATDVPEPATVALLGLGGLFLLSRKRRT